MAIELSPEAVEALCLALARGALSKQPSGSVIVMTKTDCECPADELVEPGIMRVRTHLPGCRWHEAAS